MPGPDATPVAGIFPLSREAATTNGWFFHHVGSTGSTNTDLAVAARAGDRSPSVLVTDHQTAGRGRLDRRWVDDGRGQLMVSLRLPVPPGGPQGMTGAVAVAARRVIDDESVRFKWPNDLVVETAELEGKLAGVLAEFVAGDPDVAVVGIGLNVDTAGVAGAVSLRALGLSRSRDVLLAGILDVLPSLLDDGGAVWSDLRTHSATLGRRVRVERTGGDDLIGTAIDLAPDGALLVDDGHGEVAVSVGDVVHLRTPGG